MMDTKARLLLIADLQLHAPNACALPRARGIISHATSLCGMLFGASLYILSTTPECALGYPLSNHVAGIIPASHVRAQQAYVKPVRRVLWVLTDRQLDTTRASNASAVPSSTGLEILPSSDPSRRRRPQDSSRQLSREPPSTL